MDVPVYVCVWERDYLCIGFGSKLRSPFKILIISHPFRYGFQYQFSHSYLNKSKQINKMYNVFRSIIVLCTAAFTKLPPERVILAYMNFYTYSENDVNRCQRTQELDFILFAF